MLPQRPSHVPQDLWELELPSILGVAHPRYDDLDPDSDSGVSQAAESTLSSDTLAAPPSPGCWGDLWNIPSADVEFVLSLALGEVPAPPGPSSSDLDWMAYQLCRSGRCTLSQMARLCMLLPSQQVAKRRKRSTSDGGTGRNQCTFSVGAFAAGGTQGVQLNTCAHPWTTRLLTAMVHGACSGHHFSSCTLLKNVMHYKHVDRANEPGTFNLLLPCSRWRGGQVWIANPSGSVSLDARSGPGCLLPVQMPYTILDPHVAHATYPWTDGDRILLVAHHAKGLGALSVVDRSLLQCAGFQLAV